MKRGYGLLTAAFGLVVLAVVACVGDDPSSTAQDIPDAAGDSNPIDSNAPSDAGSDVTPSKPCDPTAPFTIVAPVAELNQPGANDAGDPIFTTQARLSPDELTVYFASNRDGRESLYSATRTARSLAFGTPSPVVFDQAYNQELFSPAVGSNPDTLLFEILISNPSPPFVTVNESKRAGANWGVPTDQPGTKLALGHKTGPIDVTSDLLTLVFDGEVDGDAGKHRALFETDRATTTGTFIDHTELTALGSDYDQIQPALSSDKLTIYFATNRTTSGTGDYDIWIAQRDTPTSTFKPPVEMAGTNKPDSDEIPSWISPDQCTLYFDFVAPTSPQLRVFKAGRTPPP